MKYRGNLLMSICLMLMALTSCSDEPEGIDVRYLPAAAPADTSSYSDNPLWRRHHDSCLKILAIGNSFTINATTYMPRLIQRLNGDSICIARITRSGCSLDMHWASHAADSPDYDFYYSDNAGWVLSDIKTLDRALTFFDWDIITIQQASGWSGLYYTYQPYLENLVRLFHETNPGALLAWHYTWAYTSWTEHPEFKNYDRNPEKMYAAIIEAGDMASEDFDLRIPSATLIKRMREEFPDVENGFSSDGYHIVDDFALYALSSLWYEVLVCPLTDTSCLDTSTLPPSVSDIGMDKIDEIIRSLLNLYYPDHPDSVEMIHL